MNANPQLMQNHIEHLTKRNDDLNHRLNMCLRAASDLQRENTKLKGKLRRIKECMK